MAKRIPVGNGVFTTVDDDVYEWAKEFTWRAANTSKPGAAPKRYVMRTERRRTRYLHREILGLPRGAKTDHVDGDTLNNLRSNLRRATCAENNRNRKKSERPSSSQFKGVYWHPREKWAVQVAKKHVGYFNDEFTAARAYDAAALEKFGEFASLNFPGGR